MTDIKETLYRHALTTWGSNDVQAHEFAELHANKYEDRHGIVTHKTTGAAYDQPAVTEFWQNDKGERGEKGSHYFPPKFEVSLADRAFLDGNITARGKLVAELGPVKALELAQRYGLRSVHDTRRGTRPTDLPAEDKKKTGGAANPWSAKTWDPIKQQSICRSLPLEKAKAIATSADPPSFIGANRSGQKRLIPA